MLQRKSIEVLGAMHLLGAGNLYVISKALGLDTEKIQRRVASLSSAGYLTTSLRGHYRLTFKGVMLVEVYKADLAKFLKGLITREEKRYE